MPIPTQAEVTELMVAIQKYGDLRASYVAESFRGSYEQAETFAREALDVLAQIQAHLNDLRHPTMSDKFSS